MADANGDLDLMTVEEFAKLTGRSAAAVRYSIARGDLPAHKLGSRRYFIRKQDVHRMFEEVRHAGLHSAFEIVPTRTRHPTLVAEKVEVLLHVYREMMDHRAPQR